MYRSKKTFSQTRLINKKAANPALTDNYLSGPKNQTLTRTQGYLKVPGLHIAAHRVVGLVIMSQEI